MNIKGVFLAVALSIGMFGNAQAEFLNYRYTAQIYEDNTNSVYFNVGSTIIIDYLIDPFSKPNHNFYPGALIGITFNGFSSPANGRDINHMIYSDSIIGAFNSTLAGRPDQVDYVSLYYRSTPDYNYGTLPKFLDGMSAHPEFANFRFEIADQYIFARGTSFGLFTASPVPEINTSTSMLLGISLLGLIGLRRERS